MKVLWGLALGLLVALAACTAELRPEDQALLQNSLKAADQAKMECRQSADNAAKAADRAENAADKAQRAAEKCDRVFEKRLYK